MVPCQTDSINAAAKSVPTSGLSGPDPRRRFEEMSHVAVGAIQGFTVRR